MTLPLSSKTALVTGGSKGIGAATVILLAQQGANVVINYSSDSSAAEALAAKIGTPDRILTVKGDAASVTDIERLVDVTIQNFGKIDILIPCAGVLPSKGLEDTSETDFDKVFALNVKGPYFLAQKAVPHMPAGSHIVFLSSSLTTTTNVTPNYLLYNSTKGSIEQMTRVLAKSLSPKKINVNAIAPGPTGTELFLKGKPEAVINGIKASIPLGRLAEPDEIASSIVFMATANSRWVQGQVLRVNGGMSV